MCKSGGGFTRYKNGGGFTEAGNRIFLESGDIIHCFLIGVSRRMAFEFDISCTNAYHPRRGEVEGTGFLRAWRRGTRGAGLGEI